MGRKEKRAAPNQAKKEKVIDPIKTFADSVRDHKEFDSRWAILQESRVEYFRGKDFSDLLRKHPELSEKLPESLKQEGGPGNLLISPEVAIKLLLSRQLLVRCDRVIKTIRPGKKKLSKWPARLEFHPDQCFSDNESFYAWMYERSRPIWQTILSFMVPIFTVACCLFPLFPHWCKLVVLYFCLSFLSIITSILFLRWLVFGILWIFLGKSIWFFPNILAEECSFQDLIRFMPDDKEDKDPPPKLTTRIVVFLFTAFLIFVCVRHAPDEKTRARYKKKVGNIIDDVLQWNPAMLAGNTLVTNSTSTNSSSLNSSKSDNDSTKIDPSNTKNVNDIDINKAHSQVIDELIDPYVDVEKNKDGESNDNGSSQKSSCENGDNTNCESCDSPKLNVDKDGYGEKESYGSHADNNST